MKRRNETLILRVDPILCDGFGHCAELAPEIVTLDEWGYPIISTTPLGAARSTSLRSAQLAVRGCPRQALWIEKVEQRN